MGAFDTVLRYHRRVMHRGPGSFAPGPGYMDWENQPDPFRVWEGAEICELPVPRGDDGDRNGNGNGNVNGNGNGNGNGDGDGDRNGNGNGNGNGHGDGDGPAGPAAERLLLLTGLHEARTPAALNTHSVSRLVYRSLAISAWKQFQESRWSLRVNPSSGNLHPTEGWLLLPAIESLGGPGLFHYRPDTHALERRADWSDAAEPGLPGIPSAAFLVGLSSIAWREAWKYGERAFRYCQHDVGHAIAAIRYAAATLGWSARVLAEPSADEVDALLGLDRPRDFEDSEIERESGDLLMLVDAEPPSPALPRWSRGGGAGVELGPLLASLPSARWSGRARRLSREHMDWSVIAEVEEATRKPADLPRAWASCETARALRAEHPLPALAPPASALPFLAPPLAVRLIRRRRSAVDFDGRSSLPASLFFATLDQLLPRPGHPPLDALPWPPAVHPALFVHRVDGLAPGLFVLVRDPRALRPLQAATGPRWLWERVPEAPPHLPLFRLGGGDLRRVAAAVSCGQDIAGDGAYSVAFLAEFRARLEREGPWFYRQVHQEAGALSQVLYLWAEAAGLRATGIGCYFDPMVHQLLDLKDDSFVSIYHTAVGGALQDSRLQTLAAYGE
jgi:SagB-type dehydrogenase family enzyme